MALLRYKTDSLFDKTVGTGEERRINSSQNAAEAGRGEPCPQSYPRRLVLELTNDCNLNCIMCGRFAAEFKKTYFNLKWLERLEPILPYVEEVTLMGWGEPTIHPDFVAMLEIIRRHGARIYFCTNGMRLHELSREIFRNRVDIIAVSLDGSSHERNQLIRQGADFSLITDGIAELVRERKLRGVDYPYINFVTTLMADNLADFPDIVALAGKLGIEEAKAVYLTAFSDYFAGKTLWNRQADVGDVFERAIEAGTRLGVDVKLPYVQGQDPAGSALHKMCYVGWRDFFIGSDGFVRPCMSTSRKLFHIDDFADFHEMWEHPALVDFRKNVNIEDKMDEACALCYQSSHANWNRRESFIRTKGNFAPRWSGRDEK